jgi:hypothetical protein
VAVYRIADNISGIVLGDYEADGPAAALDALARDAGFADYAAACEAAPAKEGEISVTLASTFHLRRSV